MEFREVLDSVEQLRAVIPHPAPRSIAKTLNRLDAHCCTLIESAPFVAIASGSAQDGLDVSPKGDPAGFVLVLDERTLAIPDRPGNRRADTLHNVLRSPQVALLFVIPGRAETLRVNGEARIVRDSWLRDRLAVRGKRPELALVVSVREAFVHCGKCMLRSRLWQPESWPGTGKLPSHARCLADHAGVAASLEQLESEIEEAYRSRLY
jgi:PPOX class probable FMN-dependent enzyme